jgi:hypothetical protein
MLHNFANGVFIELSGAQHHVWQYLDGTHSLKDVETQLLAQGALPRGRLRKLVASTVQQLAAGEFVVPRRPRA